MSGLQKQEIQVSVPMRLCPGDWKPFGGVMGFWPVNHLEVEDDKPTSGGV